MNNKLILHAGAHHATLDQLEAAPLPPSTDTWFPIAHGELLRRTQQHIAASGWRITSQELALYDGPWPGDAPGLGGHYAKRTGSRMFALLGLTLDQLDVELTQPAADYQLMIGLRNSHDMSFAASMAIGSRVFVCDNLAFSADVVLTRKHTRHALGDLDRLITQAAGQITGLRMNQEKRFLAYKGMEIGTLAAHDFLVRAVDAKVISNRQLPEVLQAWREPEHVEFQPRTGWSLFNAFTGVLRDTEPVQLTGRTTRLHGMLDLMAGLGGVALTPSEN